MASNQASVHPLLQKRITGIDSWEMWLRRWAEVNTVEELTNLLHYGFDVSGLQHAISDKLEFYLLVADGHANHILTGRRPDDKDGKYSASRGQGLLTAIRRPSPPHEQNYFSRELREVVAKKAFGMLCVRFFGEWTYSQGSRATPGWFHYWGESERDVEMLRRLLAFLDPEDGADNLLAYEKHHTDLFERFLRDFITRAWSYREPTGPDLVSLEVRKHYDTRVLIHEICSAARPRLMNIITRKEWEDMFLELSIDERVPQHIETHMKSNLRSRLILSNLTTVEQALKGYNPAQILLLYNERIKLEKKKNGRKSSGTIRV